MTASNRVDIFVVEIAGLGRSGTSAVRPLAMATASAISQPSATRCDEYRAALVPGSVQFGEETFNPLTGEPATPTLVFRVVLDDAQWPEISRFFLASRNARNPVATLTRGGAGVEPDSASIPATVYASAALDDVISPNDVIYVGRTALRVSSVPATASGTLGCYTAIPDPTDPSTDSTLASDGADGVLGQIGTYLSTFPARPSSGETPPVNEDRIYTASPVVTGREVTVYRYDGGVGPETVVGRYIIEGQPSTDSDGGRTLTVRASSVIQSLKTTLLGRRAIPYTVITAIGGAGAVVLCNADDSEDYAARTLRVRPSNRDPIVMQVDRYAFVLDANGSASAGTDGADSRGVGGITTEGPQYGADAPPDIDRLAGSKAYELLVSDPMDGTTPRTPYFGSLDATRHPLFSLERPDRVGDGGYDPGVLDHPLWIVLALLGVMPSNLPEHWTCALPADYVDIDGILALSLTTYAWIDAWPGLVLGKDGKALKAMDVITEILSGIGCGLAVTPACADSEGGKLTVRSMIADGGNIRPPIVTADVMDGRPVVMDTAMTASSVRVLVAGGLNGKSRWPMVADDVYDTTWDPYVSASYELSADGLLHPDAEFGAYIRDLDRVVGLRSMYQSLASLFRYPLAVATIDVPITVQVGAGDFVPLTVRGLPSTTTGQIDESPAPALGLCLSRAPKMDARAAGWQRLKLMLMPYTLTRIGPAAIVNDVFDADTLGFSLWYVEPLNADGRYVYDGSSYVVRDVEQFEAGMVVQVRSDHHEPAGSTLTIASIDAPNNRISFTGAHGIVSAAGQILTLADLGDCRAADTAIYAFGDRDEYTL